MTFDDFLNQNNGKYVEKEDPNAPNQCFDLAFAWCDALQIPRETIRHLYAFQIWTQANDTTRQYFDLIPNSITAVPQKGDIVVFKSGWGGSVAGHVGIDTGQSNIWHATLFEQNDPLGAPAHVKTYSTMDYFGILGWLRPKALQPLTDSDRVNIIKQQTVSSLTDQDFRTWIRNFLHV